MIEPLPKRRMRRASPKNRRQEIEQCLAQFGFRQGPDRLFSRTTTGSREVTYGRRLGEALESLGPVFSAFGLYMASRVDLLPVSACLDLALITDQAEATPIAIVRDLIAQAFACSPESVFTVFEGEPFESRLMLQSHRAWLKSGEAVTVKVIHPEFDEQVECDIELLVLLKGAFSGEGRTNWLIEHAIADFRCTLQLRVNLLHEVMAFEGLAQDAQEFDMLRVPIAHRSLCSPKVSTIEHVPGLNLEDLIGTFNQGGLEEPATASQAYAGTGLHPDDLARRLCLVWLRQGLLGSWFPVQLHPRNIVVLPNKQIVFTGGEFSSLPSDVKKNLWLYLLATSTEDPDQACSCLLKEMIKEGRPCDEEELRHRFREIVPFRDGSWSRNGDSNSLAEHLFVHWQLASERGLRPQPQLLAFYRGLFQTAAAARRLAPRRDPLLDGLQEVRTIAVLAQFRELLGWQQLGDNLDKYTAMMMELPQKLDHVLTLAAESSARLRLQGVGAAGRRQKDSSAAVIALVLVLAAVVLLSHHLTASAIAGAWADRVSAIVFVFFGALLLRAASRGR